MFSEVRILTSSPCDHSLFNTEPKSNEVAALLDFNDRDYETFVVVGFVVL